MGSRQVRRRVQQGAHCSVGPSGACCGPPPLARGLAAAPTGVGLPRRQVVAVHDDVVGHGDAAVLHIASKRRAQRWAGASVQCMCAALPTAGWLACRLAGWHDVSISSSNAARSALPATAAQAAAHHEGAVHAPPVQQRVLQQAGRHRSTARADQHTATGRSLQLPRRARAAPALPHDCRPPAHLRHHIVHQVRLAQRRVRLRLLQRKAVCGQGGHGRQRGGGRDAGRCVCQARHAPASATQPGNHVPVPRPTQGGPAPTHPSASTAGSRRAATPPPGGSGSCRRQTPPPRTRRSAAGAPQCGSSACCAPSCPWLHAGRAGGVRGGRRVSGGPPRAAQQSMGVLSTSPAVLSQGSR